MPEQTQTVGHLNPDNRKQITQRFGKYRVPNKTTIPKFGAIQEKALEFAVLIGELCPHSQQKSTALTLLEQVKMQANAAIAVHEGESVQ